MTKLKIRRFPIDEMKPHRVILIIGKRGTGKSTLLYDILYHLRKKIDLPFAMSPTFDTVRMFEKCMPKSCIFDEYSLEAVQNIIKQMKALKELGKDRSALLAMDDCMFDKTVLKSKEIREVFMNGRHFNVYFVNCMQYVMDMSPDLRSQVDYLFVLKENIISNRQKIWKYFFGMFEKYNEFSAVMDKCTNNHECLVLDNTKPESEITNSIYYYKADPNLEAFRVGRSVYFKLDQYFRRSKALKELREAKKQKILMDQQDDNDEEQAHPKSKLPEPIKQKQFIDVVEKL